MISEFSKLSSTEISCVIKIVHKHTFVYEDPISKKGVFVNADVIHHIHIENENDEGFYFVQNDDCVMINERGGQCDYIVFNNKELHFVEVKATNENLKTHKKKLYKQVENTFRYYKDFLDIFENKFALVCFESVGPRGYTKRKIPQASKSEKVILFKLKYNVNLQEGNYIKFENYK